MYTLHSFAYSTVLSVEGVPTVIINYINEKPWTDLAVLLLQFKVNQSAPCSRVPLGKLIVTQLVKIFNTLYAKAKQSRATRHGGAWGERSIAPTHSRPRH
jgi:hypothetical protein